MRPSVRHAQHVAFPVEVIPQRTRIAIQGEVRFAGCAVRKRWLLANLWLREEVEHPALRKVERFGPGSFGHQFRFDSPDDLDGSFRRLVGMAYRVGVRRHRTR